MRLDINEAKKLMPKRPVDAHKGTFGTVLIVGGSRRMSGAPCIAALGALHSGAGLVRVAFPDVIESPVTAHLTEATFLPLPSNTDGMISAYDLSVLEKAINGADAVVLGCGLGVSHDTRLLTEYIVTSARCPVVLDADALNCLSKNPEILKKSAGERILTPHPGEMARLLKSDTALINKSREETAKSFAAAYGVTLLLKGHETVIADKTGDIRVNTTGNAGLSKGGSGDLLAGIIGALAANTEAFAAASLGAFIHGLAADLADPDYTQFCMSPTVCAGYLVKAFQQLV